MLFAAFWAGVSWSSSHVNAVLVLNPIKLRVVGFRSQRTLTRHDLGTTGVNPDIWLPYLPLERYQTHIIQELLSPFGR